MALQRFNEEAEKLQRRTLTFKEVLSYTFIAEFDLLRDSPDDIRNQPWTAPAVRQGMIWHLKMERAKEEMERVTVEAKRLRTWISNSRTQRQAIIHSLRSSKPDLAMELQRCHLLQLIHDDYNLRYLAKMDNLAFRHSMQHHGVTNVGTTSLVAHPAEEEGEESEDGDWIDNGMSDDGEASEAEQEDLEKLTDFLHDEPNLTRPVTNSNPDRL